jgi:hypothetical protein
LQSNFFEQYLLQATRELKLSPASQLEIIKETDRKAVIIANIHEIFFILNPFN